MTKNNNDFQQEYYSQNADTDRASHTDSAQGNTMPLVIMCFFATALFFAFGLLLFFSNVNITSMGLIESPLAKRIIVLIVMLIISLFFLILGFSYLKKAKNTIKKKMNLKTMKHLKMKFGDALVQNVENLTMFIILSAQTVNIIISSRIYQRKPSFQAFLFV